MTLLLPALFTLSNDAFDNWMLHGVVPKRSAALLTGCKKHNCCPVLITGFIGIGTLVVVIEKTLAMKGAAVLAIGYLWIFQTCQDTGRSGHDYAHHCQPEDY